MFSSHRSRVEVKVLTKAFAGLQVFNFGNWAAHRSTRRYSRHIWTILGVRLLAVLLYSRFA